MNSFDDCQKLINNLKKDFFSKLKNADPSDGKRERTKNVNSFFHSKNGEKLTKFNLKSDVIRLTCVFEQLGRVSFIEIDINSPFSVSLPGCTSQCGLKYTDIRLQTLQDEDMILFLESRIRGA